MELKTKEELNEFIKELDQFRRISDNDRVILKLNPEKGTDSFSLDPVELAEIKTKGDEGILYRVGVTLPIKSDNVAKITNMLYSDFQKKNAVHVYRMGMSLPGLPDQFVGEFNNQLELRFYARYDLE